MSKTSPVTKQPPVLKHWWVYLIALIMIAVIGGENVETPSITDTKTQEVSITNQQANDNNVRNRVTVNAILRACSANENQLSLYLNNRHRKVIIMYWPIRQHDGTYITKWTIEMKKLFGGTKRTITATCITQGDNTTQTVTKFNIE